MNLIKEFGWTLLLSFAVCSVLYSPLVVLLTVLVLVFWLKYQWICNWFAKWSKGQFVAPQKRFNFNIIHGLVFTLFIGMISFLTISSILLFFVNPEMLLTLTTEHNNTYDLMVILLPIAGFFGIWGYWKLLGKYSETGLTGRGVVFQLAYGFLAFLSWASIVVLAFFAGIAVVCIVVGYFLLKFILFACFSEEITVKRGGFFGGTKKVQATRNFDGTYTDLDGNTYK